MGSKNNKACKKQSPGAAIRAFREFLNMDQEEFGRLIGASRQSIGHYEHNRRTPRPKAAKRMIEVARAKRYLLERDEIG